MELYDRELIKTLVRCREEHKWNWGLTRRQINRQFNLDLDAPTLRSFYKQLKAQKQDLQND